MKALWQHYVYRRGDEVQEMWDRMFSQRQSRGEACRVLYIAGRGFDTRAVVVLQRFIQCLRESRCDVEKAELLLVGIEGYELSRELLDQTDRNAVALQDEFRSIGETKFVTSKDDVDGDIEEVSANSALHRCTKNVLDAVGDHTDIVLDVSSLPRILYLSILLALLQKLVPDKDEGKALLAKGVNFQVVVAEDPKLDSLIRSEDPRSDLVLIPGYSGALRIESVRHWPLVWFPILGENRIGQLQKIMESDVIPPLAEICPVLPHPSRDPRRADQLLVEYRTPLFDASQTPVSNVLYAHESHPFEVYRQLSGAMKRYLMSMRIMGGCHLVVTPLASKLITLGAGLACFEMKPSAHEDYSVAIPYAEPARYVATSRELAAADPELAVLVLTGESYG